MTARQPAPGRLSLVEDFVNTLDEEVDELLTPEDLSRWFVAHGLAPEGIDADLSALERARAVREAIRALLFANNGRALDLAAVRVLNDFAAGVPHVLRFDDAGESKLEPASGTIDGALALIMLALHEAKSDGTWQRLKACRAETCGWAFYDSSKNHSAAWCSMRVCGNRQKARRYRSRRREAPLRT